MHTLGNLRSTVALVTLLVAVGSCSPRSGSEAPIEDPRGEAPVEAPANGTPRLVLFLVVDQARADYLVRFRPLWRHGLDRLLRESVVFTDAHHDHALTKTAPGHATLATGVHPSRHGIISNDWYDRELRQEVDSDEDDRWDDDRSPHYLLVPTFADRMKERWPAAKTFGASGKSRGALLAIGATGDRAFWYDDETGRFVTSTYYGEDEPAWLEAFHEDSPVDRRFGRPWEPLPEVVAAAPEYGIEPLDRGLGHSMFPHPVGGAEVFPGESYYWSFYRTPFMDDAVFELASTILIEEQLGEDAFPDVLSLSLSAVDLVGHAFGPDSPEMLDTLLRLDRGLGELLDLIDERIGLDRVVVSFSSDHGVVPVPEVVAHREGTPLKRFGTDERLCFQQVESGMDAELGEADWFEYDLVVNRETLEATGRSHAEVVAVADRLLEQCPGVARAWTATELEELDPIAGEMQRLYRNNYFPGRSADLLIQLEEGWLGSTSATTNHGSAYWYDTHVPWLLRLPSGEGREVSDRVLTVDVAPTIAGLLGIDLGTEIDGRDRSGEL